MFCHSVQPILLNKQNYTRMQDVTNNKKSNLYVIITSVFKQLYRLQPLQQPQPRLPRRWQRLQVLFT